MAPWYVAVNGQQYGPMEESQLRQWLAEGRVTPQSLVWTEAMETWQPAWQALGLPQPCPAPGSLPPPVLMHPTGLEPHRGALVLVLGILGLVLNLMGLIPALISWSMGSKDLRAIDEGLMDPSGRGLTQAGRILGMVASILWLGVGSCFLLAIVLSLLSEM